MHTWVASLSGCRAGSSFPRSGGNFTVHSVFSRAVNLRAETGVLVSVVTDPGLAHPRAVLAPGLNFDESGLETGHVVTLNIGSLGLRFAEPETERVHSRSAGAASKERDPRPTLRLAAKAIAAVVAARSDRNLYLSVLNAGLRRLQDAVASGSTVQQWQAVEQLVGLGPGLTPAGDDLLCGFLAGLEAQGRLGDLSVRAENIDWETRTGAISAAFVTEAFRGRFGAALVAFGQAALGHRDDLASTVEALAALGHSSGTDAAQGFLGAWNIEGATA
ncbi:MAG: DUF2877 domain-containing protein [Spirochaetales bacterium]